MAGDAAHSGGSVNLWSLVLSHLMVVGPNWSLTASCPSLVPCFKTFIEHLPWAQLRAQESRETRVESQEAPTGNVVTSKNCERAR